MATAKTTPQYWRRCSRPVAFPLLRYSSMPVQIPIACCPFRYLILTMQSTTCLDYIYFWIQHLTRHRLDYSQKWITAMTCWTKNFKEVTKTPPVSADETKILRQATIVLEANGAATRTTDITGYGLTAVAVKTFFDTIGPGKERDWALKTLESSGMHGKAELIALPSNDPKVLSYRYAENVSNFISQPEASAIGFNAGLTGPISAVRILRRFTEKNRHSDFKCSAFAVEDQIEIRLAPELKVLFVPKDVHIKDGDVSFDSVYKKQQNTYTLQRQFRSTSTKAWCSADAYDAMKKTMNNIDKAFNGRLLFMNKDEARSDM